MTLLQRPESGGRAREDEVAELRRRIARLQQPTAGVEQAELATHADLAPALRLRAGSTYQIDSATVAMLVMAGPSQAGAWCGLLGVDDFGAEAAAAWGVELSRTIVVPDPGERWLEATAAIVDVAGLVVLRPTPAVAARVAPSVVERLSARLRERSCVLAVWGPWPRVSARLSLAEVAWVGLGEGAGLLRQRQAVVEVRRGTAPPRRVVIGAGVEPVLGEQRAVG